MVATVVSVESAAHNTKDVDGTSTTAVGVDCPCNLLSTDIRDYSSAELAVLVIPTTASELVAVTVAVSSSFAVRQSLVWLAGYRRPEPRHQMQAMTALVVVVLVERFISRQHRSSVASQQLQVVALVAMCAQVRFMAMGLVELAEYSFMKVPVLVGGCRMRCRAARADSISNGLLRLSGSTLPRVAMMAKYHSMW